MTMSIRVMTNGQLSTADNTVVARQTALSFEAFGNPAIPHRTDTGAGTLRIVSSWPFGGDAGESYRDHAIAIRLALDLAGSAAGGYALEYQALDNSTDAYSNVWDATTEIGNANRVLEDQEAVAFIGGIHAGALQQSIPILSRAEPPLLVVSPAATWPGLTRRVDGITEDSEPGGYYPTGGRNFVRFGPTDDRLAAAAALWAHDTAGRRTAAVFHDNGRYGRCVALAFAAAFAALGGAVTETTPLPADPINFDRHVASVVLAGADCVFLGGIATPKIAQFIGELRAQSTPEALTILGGDGLANDILLATLAPRQADGLTVVGPPLPAELTDAGAIWAATMRYRIGQSRNPDPFAIHAFEAAISVIQAIDSVGAGDRGAIIDAMRATSEFRGLSGTFSIDADGDRDSVPFRVSQVQGGRFATIGTATE